MSHDSAVQAEATEIELGTPVAFGTVRPEDVMHLAAYATPPGEGNVLERAILADVSHRGTAARPNALLEYRPPDGERAWAETDVTLDGETWTIARGDPRALVESLVQPSRTVQARAIGESARLTLGAFRPLGIAYRRGDAEWEMAGYIPVRGWTKPGRHSGGRPFDYHRVWDLPLRLTHWSWVASIVILTVTGYLLAQPQWIPAGYVDPPTGFFVGNVRLVHYLAAVVLCLVLIVRAYGLTVSQIPYDRWKSLIPFKSKRDMVNGAKTLRGYLFIKPEETPVYFGHNPLQQLTYTAVYLILLLQIGTGFALWSLFSPDSFFLNWFGWLHEWIGTPQLRLLHYMIMWGMLIFIPAHVYLSVRADSVERMGAISSMVSGGRWVRRGAVFEDWPNPDGINPPAGGDRRAR